MNRVIPHSCYLFGAEGLIFIIQSITIPLKKVDVVSVHNGLSPEKVLTKLSIVVLYWATVLTELSEGCDKIYHIRSVT